jgi:hypothetical protein
MTRGGSSQDRTNPAMTIWTGKPRQPGLYEARTLSGRHHDRFNRDKPGLRRLAYEVCATVQFVWKRVIGSSGGLERTENVPLLYRARASTLKS